MSKWKREDKTSKATSALDMLAKTAANGI